MILAFVGIFIAIGLAIGGWFRPAAQAAAPADTAPQYSDQQVADAKQAMCAARDLVNRATETAGGQTSDDPTLKVVIAVNIRVGATASADYFLAILNEYPATQSDLAAAVRETALAY
jgi:hypothetical protein